MDKEKLIELITKIRQEAEMMQGCTNHSDYAKINAEEILALLPQGDEEGLLTGKERSQIIQRDCKKWCPTKAEFLDKVGEVIAKEQLLADEIRYHKLNGELRVQIQEIESWSVCGAEFRCIPVAQYNALEKTILSL